MKDVQFAWNEACQTAFVKLKEKLSISPILRGPNWTLPFHISSDASNVAIGAVLGQHGGQVPYAIYYISKNLSLSEINFLSLRRSS